MSEPECYPGYWRDEVERKDICIRNMQALIAELYSDRGEDERVAYLCQQALTVAAGEGA